MNSRFELSILVFMDPCTRKEGVKCYMYTPLIHDEVIGETLSIDSWRFMIQEGQYRLLSFEIKN